MSASSTTACYTTFFPSSRSQDQFKAEDPATLARVQYYRCTIRRGPSKQTNPRIPRSKIRYSFLVERSLFSFLFSFFFCNILVLPIELCILFEVLKLGSCTRGFQRLCDRSDCERDFRMLNLVAILEFSHFALAYFSETEWSFNI